MRYVTRRHNSCLAPRLVGLGVLLSALAITVRPANSQVVTPTQARQINNDLANNAVAAVEVFSAGKLVATGSFDYDNTATPDVKFHTYKLPLSHMLGARSNSVRPFLEGYLGYFDLNQPLSTLNPSWGSLEVLSGTATLGGGVEVDLEDWATLVPRLQFAYSHVEMTLEGLPPSPLDQILASWRADALTVLPSLELRAHRTWGRWDVLFSSHYSYLRVMGIDDSSDLIELDSETHLWRNEISTRFHSPWRTFGLPLDFGALFARHDVEGQIRQSDFVSHFYEARGTVFWKLPSRFEPVSEISLSGAYYFQGPLTGYSVGLSLAF